MIIFDGQEYEDESQIPDMGSLECVDVDGNKRSYSGLSADMPSKLPKYDNLGTDSTAKALDNGDFYYYHAPSKTWYKQ